MNANQKPHLKQALSFAFAAFVVSVSFGAKAEYQCDRPPSQADKKACDLAKLNRPDELRLFIQRTRAIYGLYMPDYISEQDIQRWELARHSEEARPIAAKADSDQAKNARR
jgi:hypothetical protein